MEARRYLKNYAAISVTEQSQLAKKRILIVGCGGLGGYLLEYLGRLGVGYITIVDGDVFDETNLNRQLLSSQMNLGKPKVLAAKHRMLAINPLVHLETVQENLTEENAASLVKDHDIVLDALDNIPDRLLLQRTCKEVGLPLVHGALAGWYGQVCVIQPGEDLLDLIYGNYDIEQGEEIETGSLSFTAGLVASIQAGEVVKLLLGKLILQKELLVVDILHSSFERIKLSP